MDGTVTRAGAFASPVLEAEYRLAHREDEAFIARACLGVALLAVAAFVPTDYAFLGPGPAFRTLLALRAALIAATAGAYAAAGRVRTPRAADLLLTAWLGACVSVEFAILWTRPASYTGHLLTDLLVVLVGYCVMPLPLAFQAVPMLLLTAGVGVVCVFARAMDRPSLVAALVAFCAANVLGAAVSARLKARGRRLYLALAEIRTLRGILPICAHCKKVRDQEGDWHEVEEYVGARTHAQFSHGVCPACRERHYAGL